MNVDTFYILVYVRGGIIIKLSLIKRQPLELGKRVFFNFSRHSQNIVTLIRIHFSHRSSHYLKATVESLFFDNGPYDLFPGIFESLMGQVEASQLLLHLPEQEEVRLREVR
jgi:hypothetical protein